MSRIVKILLRQLMAPLVAIVALILFGNMFFDGLALGLFAIASVLIVVATISLRLAAYLKLLETRGVLDWPDELTSWPRTILRLRDNNIELKEQLAERTAAMASFRLLSDAMPDAVIALGAKDDIEWLNRRASELFAIRPDADRYATITNFVRNPEFVEFLAGRNYDRPLMLKHQKQSLMLLVNAYAANKKLLVVRDITEIERQDNMRKDFVANVSHELRTPLTVISGVLETLKENDDVPLDDEQSFLVKMAQEQSTAMAGLIEDLLTLARLEDDSQIVEAEFAVAPMLEALIAKARRISAGKHKITLTIAQAVTISGSSKELHSAWMNIITNAVRYTQEGGRIDVSWEINRNGAELVVMDNGCGIAPEHLNRLTERFYRADKGRSRKNGGTGLGLAIVKHVLNRHQGELFVASEQGRGSTFTVRLPLVRINPNSATVLAPEQVSNLAIDSVPE